MHLIREIVSGGMKHRPAVSDAERASRYELTLCTYLCCCKFEAETRAGLNLDRDDVEGETVGRTEARVLAVNARCIIL